MNNQGLEKLFVQESQEIQEIQEKAKRAAKMSYLLLVVHIYKHKHLLSTGKIRNLGFLGCSLVRSLRVRGMDGMGWESYKNNMLK